MKRYKIRSIIQQITVDFLLYVILYLKLTHPGNIFLTNICHCLPLFFISYIVISLIMFVMVSGADFKPDIYAALMRDKEKFLFITNLRNNKIFKIYNKLTDFIGYTLLILNGFIFVIVLSITSKYITSLSLAAIDKFFERNSTPPPHIFENFKRKLLSETSKN